MFIIKFLAAVYKELLLLIRDKSGLLVLFLMPAFLVVVISLVQENILKATGETDIKMLFIDKDNNELGRIIEKQILVLNSIEMEKTIDGKEPDEQRAKAALAKGDFQFCVIIPEGMTEGITKRIEYQVSGIFKNNNLTGDKDVSVPELIVYFDPVVQGSFRSSLINALFRIILQVEMELKARALSEAVPKQADAILGSIFGTDIAQGRFPAMSHEWGSSRLMDIKEKQAAPGQSSKLPTSVQQNVPAWALFGMFFIVVPLGGSLIRERQTGTLTRLMTLPVSYGILLIGKVMAYVLVCLCQFTIIMLIGKYFLPLFGMPVFEMGSEPLAVFFVVMAAALAASGYGVMLGSIAGTYEQASMFGAVSVVIGAAIGGIMVPVYVMPKTMQLISNISPLAWGLNALTDIFVRQGNIKTVSREIICLVLFFAGTLSIGWICFNYREKN
ncbi:putative ABC transport system ATP-binding domain-containing protein [Desulfonema limicola]|uniref:ABC transport system ATP-binding domain-containing protein n=1 Tax=Desulfonema limicola TaxID=45656 RepID=A0A975GI69_9BACT|nr:ABC transporter permease [Desulfonema limicola]QTA82335.1 putative ABC transport system ATP-binding domain-containing protein [Desulfonema limicola]